MRHENNDAALAAQTAQQPEECAKFGGREHSGGLVEDQHARIEAERAQDFEPHPLADRAAFDRRSGRRQIEAETRRERLGARRGGREVVT